MHLGFRLGPNQTAEDYLAIGDELLRSEGIDPTWRGFDEKDGKTVSGSER